MDLDKLVPVIPQFTLEMRHPQVGWQTIAVKKTEREIMTLYQHCIDAHSMYSFSARRIGGVQCWASIASHDGTHDYSKGPA